MHEMIGRKIGPYEIRDVIGRGGMATVYRAYQASLNRYVAIKMLPPFMAQDEQFVARFRQEALAAGGLSHPNILRISDAGTFEGQHYIVMDYVTGGTLSERMQKGPIPPDQAAELIAQIAEALDHAHRRGIVHRDLKPSNILLDEDGRPLLADFGIAQAMTSGPRLTQTNTSIGTPEYMSPEQSQGLRVDGRSDIYSLGIVLYQMLTGHVPFQGNTPISTLYQVVHEAPPPLRMVAPHVPEYLESIVMRALAKAPEARFQTGKEMAQVLRQRRVVTPPPSAADLSRAETRLVGAPSPAVQPPLAGYTPTPGPYTPAPHRAPGANTPAPNSPQQRAGYTPAPQEVGAPSIRKGAPVVLIAALVVVVLALAGVVGFMVLRGDGGQAAAPPTAPAVLALAPSETPVPPSPVVVERVITATPVPTDTSAPPTQTPVIVVVTVIAPRATPDATDTPESTNTSAPTVATTKTVAPARVIAGAATAATAAPLKPGVVLDFENFGAWKRGDQANGAFEQTAEQANSGKFSAKLSYTFPAVKDNYVVFRRAGVKIPGQPPALALRVRGDGGDHFLNIWVRDSQAEVRQFTFGRIADSTAWQTVVAPLDTAAGWPQAHISGPDNGRLDFPISFDAFVLDGVPDEGGPFRGVLYLDDLATTDTAPASQPTPSGAGATAPQPAAPAPSGLAGHIIYTSSDGGVVGVYALDVAAKNTWRVRAYARQGRIRADSRVLVNGAGGGKDNLWQMRLDGSGEIMIGMHPEDAYPDWSPSGESAVFHSSMQGDGNDRIYVQWNAGTTEEPQLMRAGETHLFGRDATWLDNWRIAFTGCDYWGSGSQCGIYAVDSKGNAIPSRLTDNPADRSSDASGGTLLVGSPRSGNWEVYAISYDGGSLRNLTNSPSHDTGAAFSPSGGQIAFMSNRDGWSIWVMNADGGGAAKLIAVPNGFGPNWTEERLSWGP